MKYLIVYVHEQGFGNVDGEFGHNPPSIEDIRSAEKQIQTQLHLTQIPKIINFLPVNNSAIK